MNSQQLWQAQALDAPRISLAYVRHHSDALQRRTRILNVINYIGGAAGMAFMAWKGAEFFSVNPLASAAIALWIAAGLLGLILQRKRMSWRSGLPSLAYSMRSGSIAVNSSGSVMPGAAAGAGCRCFSSPDTSCTS